MKIPFTCLNATAWRIPARFMTDLQGAISEEYSSDAVGLSERVKTEFEKIQNNIEPGFYVSAFQNIVQHTERYAYIKNYRHNDKKYEIEIDLLLHTYYVDEIE